MYQGDGENVIWQRAPSATDELAALRELNRELVEGLVLASQQLELCYNVCDYPGGTNSSQGRAIPVIDALIAKARGEK